MDPDSAKAFNSFSEARGFVDEYPIDCGEPTYILEEVRMREDRDFIWVAEDSNRRRAAGR